MENTIRKVYFARTKDENIWKASSSGGIFWTLATNMILNKNGVCYGAKYTKNFDVVHSRADSLDEVKKFRGSKYVQSDMRGCYKNLLDDLKMGRNVLFSGTPCQIMAVKKYIPDVFQKQLLLVEILCHGAPSPRVFKDYIAFQETVYGSQVEEIDFRGKKLKNSVQDMYIKFKSGKEYKSFGTQDIFYKFFSHELISRESCTRCKFSNTKRVADITISDYWGDIKNIPEKFEKKLGLSGVYVNTEKGEHYWNECMGNLTVAQTTVELCDQVVLHHPIAAADYKDEFWNIYLTKGIKAAYENYFGNYKKTCVMRKIKNILNDTGILEIIHKLKGVV